MKRIGLLSDTHSYWDEKFRTYFSECDEIWHAGDIGSEEVVNKLAEIKPLRAVYGNIDSYYFQKCFSRILCFSIEGATVMMTHIGGRPGKYAPDILPRLYASPPKLFISGHSHILHVEYDRRFQMLHINPGAAGKYGAQTKRTIIRFSIDSGTFKDLEVIELADSNTVKEE